MKFFAGFLLLLAASAATATTVTIDFEGVVADDAFGTGGFGDNTYLEDGFQLVAASYEWAVSGRFGSPLGELSDYGSAYYEWCSVDGFCPEQTSITLTSDFATPFSLLSLDMIAENNIQSISPLLFVVTGYFAGGGSISMSATANATSWSAITFDSSWTNLASVTFDGLDEWVPAVDNIVVSAVPVPAAIWLFGSACMLLTGLKRTRKAAI